MSDYYYNIFKNVNQMIMDRGYILENQRKNMVKNDFFKKSLNFVTSNLNGDQICVLYTFGKLKLEHLKKGFNVFKKTDCKKFIFILENNTKLKKDVKRAIKSLKTKKYLIIEIFYEKELTFNVTNNEYVPKHILLSDNQREEIIKKFKKEPLEKILKNDPQSRYYGAMVGDIFKIIRRSENTGFGFAYRIVSPM